MFDPTWRPVWSALTMLTSTVTFYIPIYLYETGAFLFSIFVFSILALIAAIGLLDLVMQMISHRWVYSSTWINYGCLFANTLFIIFEVLGASLFIILVASDTNFGRCAITVYSVFFIMTNGIYYQKTVMFFRLQYLHQNPTVMEELELI